MSCSTKETPIPVLQGKISPVTTDYILLKEQTDIERKITTIIDTLFLSKEGIFKFNSPLKPNLYLLEISPNNNILLAIDKGQHLNVEITETDTKITGSNDTNVLLAYEVFRKKSLDSLVQSIRKKVKTIKKSKHSNKEKISTLERLEVENYEKHLEELNSFIKKNMNSTLGLYATSLRWKGVKNIALYDSLTTVFETKHPKLTISAKLREKVTRLQQTSIGGSAPDIIMNNANGMVTSLSSIHKKYTLIDFWASWCGPCRSESSVLLKLYKEYHSKGFEIYGVSLDSKQEKWLNAIEKDHRIWTNVSSLNAFKTSAAYNYTVTSLPMNYLIDKNYKIIGKNLHEKELISLLTSLLDKK